MNILDKVKANPIGSSNLIYLIFPILSLTILGYKGSLWSGILVTTLFAISYLMMIYTRMDDKLLLRRVLFFIHLVGILYFVSHFNPSHLLFFFYGAYILPYVFRVKLNSFEVYMYIIAFTMNAIIISFMNQEYLIVLIPLGIVILLVMFGNFKAIESEALQEEIRNKNAHINILIAEQERHRIGRDLHDTLGQVFASLSIKSELASKLIDKDIDKARSEIMSVNALSKEALAKVRTIVDDLGVQSFDEEVKTIDELLKNANLSFEFKYEGRASELSTTKQSTLSMILREAVNNVIKHAYATKVFCEIVEEQNSLNMIIQDDGIGINKIRDTDFKSIKERTKILNGNFDVCNREQGLKITISLPKGDDSL
ncbi:sensor histidine kinase [Mammaliicoccus stepanovicii]|uniref:histidine kinase n=2 Tax=Mammaliicoccus stepanovicii TaxID=643214 RepID=A0A240A476_9STAP|nr:sensor histidine kinase [Mammaliicoccus stepanovicii]PNZ71926.1 sensor histidine kinase [Mammaliicoccus stepanovicii]GGI39433.1 two-component sensor histidine kinase [Mammaliicoccus stepanovicii]SNV77874.1 signal transduction histidine kinase [Mammaliicoccus stepanovicii]